MYFYEFQYWCDDRASLHQNGFDAFGLKWFVLYNIGGAFHFATFLFTII
jgi:hypothetical protein